MNALLRWYTQLCCPHKVMIKRVDKGRLFLECLACLQQTPGIITGADWFMEEWKEKIHG